VQLLEQEQQQQEREEETTALLFDHRQCHQLQQSHLRLPVLSFSSTSIPDFFDMWNAPHPLGTIISSNAPQPQNANDQPESMSGGGYLSLFVTRSQPADLPTPQGVAQLALKPQKTNSNLFSTVDPVAAPAPAKGPAMLLTLLSSGSGSLGASLITGLSDPRYNEVIFPL
jgi:hypothetical protein